MSFAQQEKNDDLEPALCDMQNESPAKVIQKLNH